MTTTLLLALALGADPSPIKLWDGKPPEAAEADQTNPPTLTPYLPEKGKANGAAVVVIPGGGYGALALGHEGKEIADWLTERGVAAFVLKYRIATKDRPGPLGKAPMSDAQRAVRFVRAKAKDYGVDPKKVGVWGFSAGGHLASTVTVRGGPGDRDAKDPIDRESSRPDFSVLAYPVITMGKETHGGSKRNLIGEKPDPADVEYFSNEKHVTKDTPPVFLFHTAEDKAVVIENSRLFKAALEKAGVPVELAEYEKGAHGIGLAQKAKIPASEWPTKLEAWLKTRGVLGK